MVNCIVLNRKLLKENWILEYNFYFCKYVAQKTWGYEQSNSHESRKFNDRILS